MAALNKIQDLIKSKTSNGSRLMTRKFMQTTKCALLTGLLLCAAFTPALQADGEAYTKAHPALWQISDSDTTIHLFGTLHIMRPGIDWMHGDVAAAFNQADELVLEAVEPAPSEAQQLMMQTAVDQSGQSLRSKLEPNERKHYELALQTNGLPTDALDPFKPWMASMTLAIIPMMHAGYQLEYGVDAVLQQAAEENGKRVTGLEGFEEQMLILDSLSEPLQLAMLNDTVQQMPNMQTLMSQMDALWTNGKTDELGQMMNEGLTGFTDSNELYDTLLTNRNANWASWVDQRMQVPGKVFLAVGAGHLSGDHSLIKMLESKGYTVTRVQTTTASTN